MQHLSKEIRHALDDTVLAIRKRSVWAALGWNDVRNRYNRSKLGVLWASLSLTIFVGALGPVYASLMGVELKEYILHLLIGFAIWSYTSAIILECGREFVNSSNYLISFQLSYFTLLLRVVWRNSVVLAYQMLVFLMFVLLLGSPVHLVWAVAPFAFILVTLNALWMGLLMSIFATRFRDISELMNNVLRLVFFVTPIIWLPDLNAELTHIANINPFYHLIEVFREPLLTGKLTQHSWMIVTTMTLIGWAIAFPIFVVCRSRIAFWL